MRNSVFFLTRNQNKSLTFNSGQENLNFSVSLHILIFSSTRPPLKKQKLDNFFIWNWIKLALKKNSFTSLGVEPRNIPRLLELASSSLYVVLGRLKYRLFFLRSIAQLYSKNLHELFFQFISWTNLVNSGKSMDNCWISCQVMAGMKKAYNDLTIINLPHCSNFSRYQWFTAQPFFHCL